MMPEVPRLQETLKTGEAFQPDLPRRVAEAVSPIPGAKGTMNIVFGPSATARGNPLAEAWIGWKRIVENFDSSVKLGMTRVRSVRNPFVIDKTGTVMNVEARFPEGWTGPTTQHISDVMSWWGTIFHGTAAQDAWVRTQWRLLDEAVTRYKAVGGKVRDLGLEKIGGHYYPRQVFDKKGIEVLQRSRGRGLGGKPSAAVKPRLYDFASQGTANGINYNLDQPAVLETTLSAISRATADQELISVVAPRGKTALSLVPAELKTTSAQAGREYTWSQRVLNYVKGNVRGRPAEPIFRPSAIYGKPSMALTDLVGKVKAANNLTGATRKAVIRNLVDEAQVFRDNAMRAWNQAKTAVRARRESMATTGALPGKYFGRPGEEMIAVRQVGGAVPGLGGRIFTKEDADFIINHWADMPGPLNRAVAGVSAVIRTGQTTFDPGFWFIQGLGPLGTDVANAALLRPTAFWPKAVYRSLEAFASPTRHQAYLAAAFARDPEGMTLFARYVGRISWTEFTEAAKPGGLLVKVPILGRGARRFTQFFDAYANASQTEMWLSTYRMAHGDPAKLDQLGAWIRNTTLGVSSDRIGLTPTQMAVESNWILYAPRYRRGGIALAFDALRAFVEPGSLRARQSLKSLAGIAAAGTLMYVGSAKAVGMSDEEIIAGLNPFSGGRFMSIRIGGNYIGIGGVHRSLINMIARLGQASVERPTDFLGWMPKEWSDNPIISAFRSGGAPATSTTFDLLSRKTFIGQPLEDWGDIGKVGQQWLPFWAGAMLEANGSLEDRLLVGVAQLMGLRAFPMNPWSQLDYQISQMGFTNSQGQPLNRYADLTLPQQEKAEANPELKRLLDMAHADAQGIYAKINDIQEKREEEINWEVYKLRKAGPTAEALQYFADTIKEIKRDAARDSENALTDAGADSSDVRNPDKKIYTDFLEYISKGGRDAEVVAELGQRYRAIIGPEKTKILDAQIAADRNPFVQQYDTWKLEFSNSGYWDLVGPDGKADSAARLAFREDNPYYDAIGYLLGYFPSGVRTPDAVKIVDDLFAKWMAAQPAE
jgi:hypothetical protein